MTDRSTVTDERRHAIRNILYHNLPMEINADLCRTIADEFLALEAPTVTERQCTTCGAGVAASDDTMACHCTVTPWKLREGASGHTALLREIEVLREALGEWQRIHLLLKDGQAVGGSVIENALEQTDAALSRPTHD